MISPKRVLAQVAIRSQQIAGTSQAALEANYNTANLATVLDGGDIPYSAMRDTVLAAEAELAEIIANDIAHPYRDLLAGRSADLESGDPVPTTSNGGIEFIGVFSGANDSDDDLPLIPGPMQEILRFQRTTPSRYTTDIRKYRIENGYLYHTREEAYLNGCVFSRAAALARFSSTDESPLPASLEATWIARSIELLASEGWLIAEGQYYAQVSATGIEKLKMRDPNLPTF